MCTYNTINDNKIKKYIQSESRIDVKKKNALNETLTVRSDEQVYRLPGDLWMPVINAVCPTSIWDTAFNVPSLMEKECSLPVMSPAHTSQSL